jgi:hypothetical protein
MTENRLVNSETWELVKALVVRTDLGEAAGRAFRRAYPDAPLSMIDTAMHHVYGDGIDAALEWLAATERFLRGTDERIDYGHTWHLFYHLHNWLQFQSLLPIGREGVLERLKDMKLFLAEGDTEAAEGIRKHLEELIEGSTSPPGVG